MTDSKLQGASRLAVKATLGVTKVVEDMHNRIVHPPFLPSTPVQRLITKITGLVYTNIRGTTKLVGSSIEVLLEKLVPLIGTIKPTNQSEGFTSVLNGVIGDYLEETDNPLKIEMSFRYKGKSLRIDKDTLKETYPNITGNILLLIHGSSMNDLQWSQNNSNHAETIAEELAYSPVYLHYNSGKHISTNGKELSQLIEQLINVWPLSIKKFTILAHSMGGLIARSAIYYAGNQKKSWVDTITNTIFLGTPHHGSPLEKYGNFVDIVLDNIPYTKPLASLCKIRSAGVTDLRYGNVTDEDWKGSDRFKLRGDTRIHVPLSTDIENYCVAATKEKEGEHNVYEISGDGLVPVHSALGSHKNVEKHLNFKSENTRIIFECNHMSLLSKPEVYEQLIEWLR